MDISFFDRKLGSGEVTRLLQNLQDDRALGDVIGMLYQDLRRIAGSIAAGQQTMQPTALVNEIYVYLTKREKLEFQNRDHFLNSAALIMRQVLGKYARAKKAAKRGGDAVHVPLENCLISSLDHLDPDVLMAMDDAFTRLETLSIRKFRIAVLRHYLGLSTEEIARSMDMEPHTVRRDWQFCRTWLARELRQS